MSAAPDAWRPRSSPKPPGGVGAFLEIRRRLIAEGAHSTESGLVTGMGSMWSFTFYDPDEGWLEIMWVKPDAPFNSGITRPDQRKMIDPGAPTELTSGEPRARRLIGEACRSAWVRKQVLPASARP